MNHLGLWGPIFVDYGYSAYFWGCIFFDASVFSFRLKFFFSKFVFVKVVNSWVRATHQYHENEYTDFPALCQMTQNLIAVIVLNTKCTSLYLSRVCHPQTLLRRLLSWIIYLNMQYVYLSQLTLSW